MTVSGNVRFQIRKLTGGRLNIDNISISDYTAVPAPTDDSALTMGNPSNAVTDVAFPNNYLLVKSQYTMAYNNSKGSCAWVGWHLQASDMGAIPRCDCFTQDAQLPSSFYRASSTAYTNSGFDRGHQCPSADRNNTATNNAATFLMSNMLPQAPNLNQITWSNMEDYERTLVAQGNEVFIISGGYGSGGTGSLGGVTTSINGGLINVPARCWKVIVVLVNGTNDAGRVTTSNRVIAVDMPNTQTVNANAWGYYRVTVDSIEAATGYNFLSNIAPSIQSIIEATIDNGPTQ
jgi:endonuclease G